MSRTNHSSTVRRVKDLKREVRERQILRRALDLQDYDNLPSRLPTREVRTF